MSAGTPTTTGLALPPGERAGFCPACESEAGFVVKGTYLRSALRCKSCDSVPRHRALFWALQRLVPNWRNLSVHESSPGWDIVSRRLANESRAYTASYLDPQVQRGAIVESVRTPSARYSCQDLERQTFDDASFDLVVTQDVFEHIFRPDLAIAEIARTLRPGGATIMTVPLVRGVHRSRRRARKAGETVELLIEPAEFHGNPIDGKGSLVTIDWGYDIVDYLMRHSGLSFLLLRAEDPHRGIVGDLLEVLIGFKRPSADL